MKIKKILVSQPQPTTEKSPYSELAEKYGLKLEFRPFIKVEGVTAKEFRQERINILDHTAIIFTSRTAIDHFFRICGELRITVPDTMKYFCISEATAFYLQKYIVYRKRKIFYGDKKVDDMTKILLKHKTENFLVPLSDIHKENIPGFQRSERYQKFERIRYHSFLYPIRYKIFIPEFPGLRSGYHSYSSFRTCNCSCSRRSRITAGYKSSDTPMSFHDNGYRRVYKAL